MQKHRQAEVLIVGAGPAGLVASLCLRTFNLGVLHIDNRPEPTRAGRADGLQPRTLEVIFFFSQTVTQALYPQKHLSCSCLHQRPKFEINAHQYRLIETDDNLSGWTVCYAYI